MGNVQSHMDQWSTDSKRRGPKHLTALGPPCSEEKGLV